MCLIAFAWQAHPRWRLLLAGNRDEFHARPSAPLARWADAPITGGRDLEAGGTWLAVAGGGRCAAVTNVRDPGLSQQGHSRGWLINEYLTGDADASSHALALGQSAARYRPFNLLVFDRQAAFYVGNHGAPQLLAISAGVHSVSNAAFDTSWPKSRAMAQQLTQWLDASGDEDFSPLFAALADERIAADALLPDTGVGIERERWLSAAFIRGPTYGTRASTVVALAHDGTGVIVERRFGPGGRFDGETILPIES